MVRSILTVVTSQTMTAVAAESRTPTGHRQTDEPGDMKALLSALDDDDCRTMLAATADEARSASELSERCDLPRSTTYRKLELLTEAGLLESGVRIHSSGHHTSEYARAYDDVVVGLAGDELSVELVRGGEWDD